eukprot:4595639-Pyramimonas_sp.AAC.1
MGQGDESTQISETAWQVCRFCAPSLGAQQPVLSMAIADERGEREMAWSASRAHFYYKAKNDILSDYLRRMQMRVRLAGG